MRARAMRLVAVAGLARQPATVATIRVMLCLRAKKRSAMMRCATSLGTGWRTAPGSEAAHRACGIIAPESTRWWAGRSDRRCSAV
jgi:hypothetical protein